jgi:hypothetical protein
MRAARFYYRYSGFRKASSLAGRIYREAVTELSPGVCRTYREAVRELSPGVCRIYREAVGELSPGVCRIYREAVGEPSPGFSLGLCFIESRSEGPVRKVRVSFRTRDCIVLSLWSYLLPVLQTGRVVKTQPRLKPGLGSLTASR